MICRDHAWPYFTVQCPSCAMNAMKITDGINVYKTPLVETVEGVKYDQDKPHMNLLLQEIPNALVEVSECLRIGEQKYGRGNWRKVENKEDRYLAALMRHLTAYYKGERTDPESGKSHLAHVAVNALFLLDSEVK